ncbi:aldo/keto reductase [bacterium]|nr:aldo/keto reductase [bacterium]
MTLRNLGRTALRVSPLCLGGNVFGWTADETASFAVLDAYVASGGNFIDTAEVYSRWVPGHHGGESEAILGRWLKSRKNRDQLVIATKVGAPMGDAPEQKGLSRRRILDAVEGSLRRLQTDVIDLYQAHFDDPGTALDETLATFDELVKAGKVRHIGASNYTAPRLNEALETAQRLGLRPFETMQPEYNLLDREQFEGALQALCLEHGLGVITYYSLASGFLSGKYRKDQPLPTSSRAASVQREYMNPRGFRVIEALDAVAAAHQATVSQVALAWVMAQPGVTSAIASATSAAQAQDLLGALRIQLDAEAQHRLSEAGKLA